MTRPPEKSKVLRKLRCAVYPGEHDAIIDRETWDRVHAILQESCHVWMAPVLQG